MKDNDIYLRHRHQRKTFKILYPFLLLLMTAIFLHFLVFNQVFLVDHLEISTTSPAKERVASLLDTEMAGKKFGFVPANNFIFLDQSKIIANLLKAEPSFESFKINYAFGTRQLNISSQKREPVATICQKESCFATDAHGISFVAPESDQELLLIFLKDTTQPDIVLGQKSLPESLIHFSLKIKERGLPGIKIASVAIEENYIAAGFLKFITEDGWHFLTISSLAPETVIKNLSLILEKEVKDNAANLEYVDLRYPDKAYYKLK